MVWQGDERIPELEPLLWPRGPTMAALLHGSPRTDPQSDTKRKNIKPTLH